jgi:hypothetical protein
MATLIEEVTIDRFEYGDKQVLGIMMVGNKQFYSLELDWQNNQRRESCIPPGRYRLKKRYSGKYGHHFHVLDVPGRDMILIHHGNYHTDILGCILIGLGLHDINKDGLQDVTSSKVALSLLNKLLPDECWLNIAA